MFTLHTFSEVFPPQQKAWKEIKGVEESRF